jgi:phosphatidylserine decarboxylase
LIPDESEASLDSKTEAVRFLDRETGIVKEETIYGRAALEFAYQTELGRSVMRFLPHGPLSRMYGLLNRLPSSRRKISGFIDSLGIDADEATLPVGAYRTLDEFFCRQLKPEARPIEESPLRFLAPADGRTMVFPYVGGREFAIKGCRVCLTELLDDNGEAERFSDGTAIIVRLAPCDYHRFHFPDSGCATNARPVSGRLHSVHPIALENKAPSFNNKRSITFLESESFGDVALIEVGAFAVGTIVQTYQPGQVKRGQEKGYFRFGGSTVVVLVPPNRLTLDVDLIGASERGLETFVKMGTSIGSTTSR